MEKTVTIPRKERTHNSQDFHFLKESALKYIQDLTGKIWTDYNVHDPGMTLLEILAYAVTELGYVQDFPVPDLLATPAKEENPLDTFFAPDEILYSAPLTDKDYNRLFLDIEEIRIARLVPSRRNPDFQGIYDLEVQLIEGANPTKVRQKILDLYHSNRLELPAGPDQRRILRSNRNLCEDLDEIRFIDKTLIRFGISLEIQETVEVGSLLSEIVTALNEYLSPPVRFFRHQQLLKEGLPMEEIVKGPRLAYGFIPDRELEHLQLTEEIRTSDLMQLISDLSGVDEIKYIEIKDKFNIQHAWVCQVEKGKVPTLDMGGSYIELYNRTGGLVYEGSLIHKRKVMQDLAQLRTTQKAEDFQVAPGRYYDRLKPFTLQNEFPRIFGIGDAGLPARVTEKRKSEAKQLQGFLLFFEQTIGNFFAQIANLNKVFSLDAIDQTRYYQPLLEVPGAEYLYQPFISRFIERHIDLTKEKVLQSEWHVFKTGFLEWKQFQKEHGAPCSDPDAVEPVWKAFCEQRLNPLYLEGIRELDDALYDALESRKGFLQRRNDVLDHLLARFAMDSMEYNLFRGEEIDMGKRITNKLNILRNWPYFSRSRGVGRDLGPDNPTADLIELEDGTIEMATETNLSGLESSLQLLFDIPARPLNYLANRTAEDFLVGDIDPPRRSRENFMNIDLFDTGPNRAVHNLFRLGLNPDNYRFAPVRRKYELRDEEKKVVARFSPPARDNGRFLKVTPGKLIEQVRQAGTDFECLYVVEHLMLRPLKSSPNFGFAIHSPRDGRLLFDSQKFWSWKNREEVLLEVLDLGRKAENYKVRQLGHRQYKVNLKGDDYDLLGALFIETEEETYEALKEYVIDFQQLFEDNIGGKSEAERLFRLQDPGRMVSEPGSAQSLIRLFEAGFLLENFHDWEEENGVYVRVVDPETDAVYQSFQRIESESPSVRQSLANYFKDYCQKYFSRHYLENVYRHPNLKFRTSRYELYDELTDPWSQTLTVVIPGFPPRFQDSLFRSTLKKAICSMAPAHLVVNIRWMKFTRLREFEELYRKFLEARRDWQQRVRKREASLDRPDRNPGALSDQVLDRVMDRSVAKVDQEVSLLGDQLIQLITEDD